MATIKIKNDSEEIIQEFYMEDRLKYNLEEKVIKQIQKKDKDVVLCIDGREGTGKSTLAIQIGKFVDPSLDLSRIVFSPEDFREAVLRSKKGQCIIYDEAFTGFSSRSSLSPINRVLVSLSMQMRQKNLFILIVLPTIFMLDKYMAMFRTKALIHVFESKGRRGYFRLFNSKKKKFLILLGSKTMSYNVKGVYSRFNGRFYGKFGLGDKYEEEYRKKKEKALSESEKTSMSSAQVRYRDQRNLMIYLFRRFSKMKVTEMVSLLNNYEFSLSPESVYQICSKFGIEGSSFEEEIKDNKALEVEDLSNIVKKDSTEPKSPVPSEKAEKRVKEYVSRRQSVLNVEGKKPLTLFQGRIIDCWNRGIFRNKEVVKEIGCSDSKVSHNKRSLRKKGYIIEEFYQKFIENSNLEDKNKEKGSDSDENVENSDDFD
jgi:biotin operon repressor